MTKKDAAKWLGPSLAESKRDFVREYGSELELLLEVNNWLQSEEKGGVTREQPGSGSSFPF
jgi:hypothetical protein